MMHEYVSGTPSSTPRSSPAAPKDPKTSNENSYPAFFDNIKRFDIYTKLEEDYRLQTMGGATLSIIAWIVITFLVIGELYNYRIVTTKEHLKVDTTFGQKLQITLDITFHALTCAEAHLDAMDVAGDNQLNIEHSMFKQRVTQGGMPIDSATAVHSLGASTSHVANLPADYCGSCFGAETETIKCCNSCMALKRAYSERDWSIGESIFKSEQCQREDASAMAMEPGEGCRIAGTMQVNKVAGNFHIAHGVSVVMDGRHIHQFLPQEAHTFNISHTIHHLTFGQAYPGASSSPLEKVSFIVPTDGFTGLKQYYIKIVPTYYQDQASFFSAYYYTNQYIYTDRFRPLMVSDPQTGILTQQMSVLPGIFFVYDLQPFIVHTTKTSMPLTHLLTRLLAIVGGSFSVLGMLDSLIFRVQKVFFKTK